MSAYQPPEQPMQPVVLSMEVDDDDSFEIPRDTLSFPIQSLPSLPWYDKWTIAHISRDETSGDLKTSISNRILAGVKCQWHHALVDCLEVERTKSRTAMAFEAVSFSILPITSQSSATIFAEIARFEWETRVYQLLEGSGLTPRFLGHIHGNGRIMGFLLEKIEGHPASIQDLDICETALGKLHELGFSHGDANRYNFLVTEEGVKLLDFERLQENASPESMHKELENVRVELTEESG